jgi:hypothetical protein
MIGMRKTISVRRLKMKKRLPIILAAACSCRAGVDCENVEVLECCVEGVAIAGASECDLYRQIKRQERMKECRC